MTQTAKAQEPSMEEILASIRRIIADDDAKPAKGRRAGNRAAGQAAGRGCAGISACAARQACRRRRPSAATPAAAANSQDEIDAMLAELDGPPKARRNPPHRLPRPMCSI